MISREIKNNRFTRFLVALLFALSLPVLTCAQKDTIANDTLPYFKARIPEYYKTGGLPKQQESIYIVAYDSIKNVKIFILGDTAYLAYKDTTNRNKAPFTDNWIVFPMFKQDYVDNKCNVGYFFGDGSMDRNFHAEIECVPSTKHFSHLSIKWKWTIVSRHRIQAETEGCQFWNLKTKICSMDIETRSYEYLYMRARKNKPAMEHEYECKLETHWNKDEFVISSNDCGVNPKAGKYKLTVNSFVRQKVK